MERLELVTFCLSLRIITKDTVSPHTAAANEAIAPEVDRLLRERSFVEKACCHVEEYRNQHQPTPLSEFLRPLMDT